MPPRPETSGPGRAIDYDQKTIRSACGHPAVLVLVRATGGLQIIKEQKKRKTGEREREREIAIPAEVILCYSNGTGNFRWVRVYCAPRCRAKCERDKPFVSRCYTRSDVAVRDTCVTNGSREVAARISSELLRWLRGKVGLDVVDGGCREMTLWGHAASLRRKSSELRG